MSLIPLRSPIVPAILEIIWGRSSSLSFFSGQILKANTMFQPPLPLDIHRLTIPQRVQLVEQIWDNIAEQEQAFELTSAQKKELDRRVEAHHAAPDRGKPWEEVKKRLLGE